MRSLQALWELDLSFVDTPDYMGFAPFWDIAFKWWLRDASARQRQRVHATLMTEGLPVGGFSQAHIEVVCRTLRVDAASRAGLLDELKARDLDAR